MTLGTGLARTGTLTQKEVYNRKNLEAKQLSLPADTGPSQKEFRGKKNAIAPVTTLAPVVHL